MTLTATAIFDQIAMLRQRGEDFCVVTVVRTANATSAKAGAKAIVTGDGVISGFIGGACVQGTARRAAAEVLQSGKPRLIRVKPKEDVDSSIDGDGVELRTSACPSGGTVELFIEPMMQAPRLIVLGASPVGAALVSLAGAMGYRTLVACPAADQETMPGAHDYESSFGLDDRNVVPSDTLVIATQGRGDRPALEVAISSQASYIAFVGSRRKAEKLKQDMAGQGCDDARLSRIKAPAGLDIGAIEPEEIAVSIMAEIIQSRRQRQKQPLEPDA